MRSSRIDLFLLRAWWAPPLYRYAFRKVLADLESGTPGVLESLLSTLWSSSNVRLTLTVLQLLVLLPDELLCGNGRIESHFPKELFLHGHVRDRISLCRAAIETCFKLRTISILFLAPNYAAWVQSKRDREMRLKCNPQIQNMTKSE